jgi:hypothetical protein
VRYLPLLVLAWVVFSSVSLVPREDIAYVFGGDGLMRGTLILTPHSYNDNYLAVQQNTFMYLTSNSYYASNYNLSVDVEGFYLSLPGGNLEFTINSTTIYNHFNKATLTIIPLRAYYTTDNNGKSLITSMSLTLIHKSKITQLTIWKNGLINASTDLEKGLYTLNVTFQIPQGNLIYQPIYLNITSLVIISPVTGVYYSYFWNFNISLTGFVLIPLPPVPPAGLPESTFHPPFNFPVNGNYTEQQPVPSSTENLSVIGQVSPVTLLELLQEGTEPKA